MKNYFKLLIAVFAFVLLTNCEKEEIVIDNSQQTENNIVKKSAFEKLSIDELKLDNNFRKAVKDFDIENDIFSTNNIRKSGSVNNYVIDTSSVIKIQQDDYTSYTFAIKRDNQEEDVLENLVIEQKKDSVQGFFMKYKFSQKYMDSLAENKSIPFEGTIQRTRYKNDINKLLESLNDSPSSEVHRKNMICIRTTVTVTTNCKGTKKHRYGDESCPLLGTSDEATQTTTSGDMCFRTGGGASSWSDEYNPSNNGTAGGYNPNGSNTGVNDPYDEERALSKRADRLSSKLGLNGVQRGWLRSQKNENLIGDMEAFLDDYDPILSKNLMQDDYEAKIRHYIKQFRRWGSPEFANLLESLLPLDNSFDKEDYFKLYELIKTEKAKLLKNYIKAFFGQVYDSFEPLIEFALLESGAGLGLKILQKLPAVYKTLEVQRIINRLTTTTSSLSKFKHASKYGIKSYTELGKVFENLGIKRLIEKVQFHHLYEQRFLPKTGGNTNNWKSIVLTKTEHQIFTNAWKNAIGYEGKAIGSTGFRTGNVPLSVIKSTAKSIYKDYPEILKALGL